MHHVMLLIICHSAQYTSVDARNFAGREFAGPEGDPFLRKTKKRGGGGVTYGSARVSPRT
jgi:hypothetical protein